MTESALILGAVAYDPKVITIWDGFQQYFHRRGLLFDYVLYTSYERQVEALAMLRATYSSIPLVRSTFHQHKFHLSDVHGLCGNHSGCVFLKNDGLVFYESKQITVELYALLLSLDRFR